MTQQIDADRYDEIRRTVETMDTREATDYVMHQGIQPPSDAPGWQIVLDYPPGHGGAERLVWTRSEFVVLEPEPVQ